MMFLQFRHFLRRFVRNPPATVRVVTLLVSILAYGTTGFLYFELPGNPALTWIDGFWYSIVTVTTIGYGDLAPKTLEGRALVAFPLMFVGIGLLGYVLSLAASTLVEAKAKELHGMSSFKFKNHLVIINFSDVGKVDRILDELAGDPDFIRSKEVVLVDEDLVELPGILAQRGVHFVRGNPTRDETLSRASVDDASHAIILSKHAADPKSDSLSVAITVAIEARSPRVVTVVECVDAMTEELLRKAGCDSVVCASRFDAHFLSHELLNPGVQRVVEQLTSNRSGQQLFLTSCDKSSLSYERLAAWCRERGHLPVGIRRGHETTLNPPPDFNVAAGDQIISIGDRRLPRLVEV